MRVLEMPWFTDNCPLSLTLKLQSSSEQISSKLYKGTETECTPLKKYIWNADSDLKYGEILNSDEFTGYILDICSKIFDNTSQMTEEFTNLLIKAADKSLRSKIYNRTKLNNTNDHLSEFDYSLQQANRHFKKCRRNFCKDTQNSSKRKEFLTAKAKYRKAIKAFKHRNKEAELNSLQKMKKKIQNYFGKKLEKLY